MLSCPNELPPGEASLCLVICLKGLTVCQQKVVGTLQTSVQIRYAQEAPKSWFPLVCRFGLKLGPEALDKLGLQMGWSFLWP